MGLCRMQSEIYSRCRAQMWRLNRWMISWVVSDKIFPLSDAMVNVFSKHVADSESWKACTIKQNAEEVRVAGMCMVASPTSPIYWSFSALGQSLREWSFTPHYRHKLWFCLCFMVFFSGKLKFLNLRRFVMRGHDRKERSLEGRSHVRKSLGVFLIMLSFNKFNINAGSRVMSSSREV